MSDFESRLTDALSSGAEGAPDASGLAAGARSRSRRRRRARLVVAAAVGVAVAVPVGVAVLGDEGGGRPPTADDPAPAPEPDADTRIETWHDVQVEVPASWGYGARSAWCTGGDETVPVVERPGGVVPMIACTPTYSYGVSWGSSSAISPVYPSGHVWQYEAGDIAEYAPGSWLGYWYEGDDLVQVNAADKETVQAIIDSVQVVDSVDGNGCPVTREEGFTTDSEQMSVCRYDAGGELEQSELLSVEDTAAAIAALNEAPPGDPGKPTTNCQGQQPERLVVDLITTDLNSEVIIQAPCPYRPGITSGGESFQELTEDVLYWALSPGWSGGLQQGVPLPDPLRGLPTPEPAEPETSGACKDQIGPTDEVLVATEYVEGQPTIVCRYELDWEGESGGTFLLDRVETIPESEAQRVAEAIDAAPEATPATIECRRGSGELFVVSAGRRTVLVYNAECGLQGVVILGGGNGDRETTPDLLDALGSPYGLLR